jgi:septum site-determining protein MinD
LIGIVLEDEQVLVSTNLGAPAALNGESKAGQAFRDIAKRIRGEDVPYASTEKEGGLLQMLKRIFGGR